MTARVRAQAFGARAFASSARAELPDFAEGAADSAVSGIGFQIYALAGAIIGQERIRAIGSLTDATDTLIARCARCSACAAIERIGLQVGTSGRALIRSIGIVTGAGATAVGAGLADGADVATSTAIAVVGEDVGAGAVTQVGRSRRAAGTIHTHAIGADGAARPAIFRISEQVGAVLSALIGRCR